MCIDINLGVKVRSSDFLFEQHLTGDINTHTCAHQSFRIQNTCESGLICLPYDIKLFINKNKIFFFPGKFDGELRYEGLRDVSPVTNITRLLHCAYGNYSSWDGEKKKNTLILIMLIFHFHLMRHLQRERVKYTGRWAKNGFSQQALS